MTVSGREQAVRERAESYAERFHEAYERLAPQFEWTTNEQTAVPWSAVPGPNKSLMIAVAGEVVGPLLDLVDELTAALRISYPMTPVDCLISELREGYCGDYATREIFEARVRQFKDEVTGRADTEEGGR